ncbi:MAG: hypothetical protein JNL85_09895 [Rubrivivax sp.]|nr:hypothetical protein [Rubrivivax sp.]
MAVNLHDNIQAVFAGADKAFAASGNVIEALGWVRLAAKAGLPIPPNIGRWLSGAIGDYLAADEPGSKVTMDRAMGLSGTGATSGKGQPRRKAREARTLNNALGDMWILLCARATKTEAATLAAAKHGKEDALDLMRSYGESWHAHRQDNAFEGMGVEAVRAFLADHLAGYPDSPLTAQEKAAIGARWA